MPGRKPPCMYDLCMTCQQQSGAEPEMTPPGSSNPSALLDREFSLMAKPAGPDCNLGCEYCFYCEKKVFFPAHKTYRMSDEVLEAYVREYIASQSGPSVQFDWQGGEPALAGIDFFQRALDFQRKYRQGKRISNTIQTNGTLLDQAWCIFLARNNFLVGLSMDGPEAVHNAYRVDKEGKPTFAGALNSLKMMQRHGVEVNILATVNRESSRHPLEVYRFFRQQSATFIQFIPVVEREPNAEAEKLGISLAVPPSLADNEAHNVTKWSVEPVQYGEFLLRIFDEWKSNDVGRMFVMNFEWIMAALAGVGPGVCYLAPRCGDNLILEHNGDIYSCDHFMYPAYRLGNILDGGLKQLVRSSAQRDFGARKESALNGQCRRCEAFAACRGGCPKHRFATGSDGLSGLNYFCEGYLNFYRHAAPSMRRLLSRIQSTPHIKEETL